MKSALARTALAATLASAATTTAHAQAQLVPTEVTGAGDDDVPRWSPSLGLTATLSLVSNSNVVGQVDGFSTLFGLGLVGGLDYVVGKHVLRNTLSISESFARTPVIDEFVKTNDVIQLEGLYNYYVIKIAGAFARLSLTTAALPADDVRAEPTSWVLLPREPGGPITPLEQMAFRQRLAGSLEPFTINESVGGFAEPIQGEKLALSLRLGLGGRHTFASGVRLNDDNDATPEVELIQLANVHQLGVEAFAGAAGKLRDGRATYKAGVSLLFPFVNNDDFDRSATALTRLGLEASLSFNVFEWMSLVYSLNITRDPQLFPEGDEKLQVQNSLLLTFQFAIVKKDKTEKLSEDEQKLADANKRADDAEAARQEAERKVLELEQKVRDTEAACAAKPCTPTSGTPTPAPAPAPAPTPTP